MSEWISVKDKLPLQPLGKSSKDSFMEESYLATDGIYVTKAYFQAGRDWCGWNGYNDIESHEITHWMPLPEPPKEKS